MYVYTMRNYLLHSLPDKCMDADFPFAAKLGTAGLNNIQEVLEAVRVL